jgi:hypothetical protein
MIAQVRVPSPSRLAPPDDTPRHIGVCCRRSTQPPKGINVHIKNLRPRQIDLTRSKDCIRSLSVGMASFAIPIGNTKTRVPRAGAKRGMRQCTRACGVQHFLGWRVRRDETTVQAAGGLRKEKVLTDASLGPAQCNSVRSRECGIRQWVETKEKKLVDEQM